MTVPDVLGGPAAANLGAPLARANPVAKLAVAVAVSAALVLTVDVVTAGVALALEAVALPWCGLGPWALLRRGWIVIVGAVPAGITTAMWAVDSGAVLAGLGPMTVTEGSLLAGAAITLRVLAIGLPGVVLLATTDPTDLADALAQNLRLPHRFVLAALAAMRLFGVLAEEWRALTMARRARGVGDGGLGGRLRTLAGQVFALLVLAVRRATVLATAMEARGFGVAARRTWARPSRFGPADAVVALGGVALAALATAAGIAAGTWNLVLT
ncbi:MAG: energy-coupling factor transporter transmembrane protein EcfT [Actinomycetales bacterium]|nr:energy-coupling factor transporter transmembrane protein EcfT [Actinomycetales bacterium]